MEHTTALHTRSQSREDKLVSAKKKLKNYRKAQASRQGVPPSPSSKRSSIISNASAAAGPSVPASPLRSSQHHARRSSSGMGHVHRRSRSRISVSIPRHSNTAAKLSALLAMDTSVSPDATMTMSTSAGQKEVIVTSYTPPTPVSPRRSSVGPLIPASTPTRTALNSGHPPSSSLAKSHSRRDSRRHSRTLSIVSTTDAQINAALPCLPPSPFMAQQMYGLVSPPPSFNAFSSSSRMPASASSPALSSSASRPPASFAAFSFGNSTSSTSTQSKRQSVPNFSAAPSSRILSPQTSPVLHQSSSSMTMAYAQQQQHYGRPTSSNPDSPLRKRSASTMQQPSFAVASSSNTSMPMAVNLSTSSTATILATSAAPSHARKLSKHTRRTSVATRRESMEIMSGIPSLAHLQTSPDMNASATAAFLASTASERGSISLPQFGGDQGMSRSISASTVGSAGMSRSSTWTSLGSGQGEERDAEAMTDSSCTSTERSNALSALEGRLRTPSETIHLPTQAAIDSTNAFMSPSPASSKMSMEQRRGSWTPNSMAHHLGGGRGATDLGMLVEEEEEEEEQNDEMANATSSSATIANASLRSSTSTQGQGRKPRPSSLIFPPSRSLPFGTVNNLPTIEPISPTTQDLPYAYSGPSLSHSQSNTSAAAQSTRRPPPRPLSLSSSIISSPNTSEIKSAKRLSGLKTFTLGSAGAASSASESPISSKRLSLASERGASPISALRSSGSIDGRFKKIQQRQSANASPTPSKSATYSVSSSAGARNSSTSARAAYVSPTTASSMASPFSNALQNTTAATTSFANSFGSAGPANFSSFSNKRFSELSSASATSSNTPFTFGDLVIEDHAPLASPDDIMHDRIAEEDEDVSMEDVREKDLLAVTVRPGLVRSSSSNSTNSDDPVILSMQVQAMRQKLDHQTAESAKELASAQALHRVEVSNLRQELSTVTEQAGELEAERDCLREDIDGWRTRCGDLEHALANERARLEDERKEGILLRDKVRKLGDRLAAHSSGIASTGSSQTEDQQHTAAQAKLIAEMRDQIFSLAAALERERLKAAGDSSRSTSPLLTALNNKEADERAREQRVQNTLVIADSPRPALVRVVPSPAAQALHQAKEGSNASSAGFNGSMSSKSSSVWSGYSSVASGHTSEGTSIADDESVFGNGKSPVSPSFYLSSAASSFSLPSSASPSIQTAVRMNAASIHPTSLPLKREDSLPLGGLDTLAEEDEESTEGSEGANDAQMTAIIEEDEDELGHCEEDDHVPELIPDEFRGRTQSTSTDSADTNEQMPLTPCKESPAGSVELNKHHRSDSFLKQWSFPRGSVEQTRTDEQERFWQLFSEPLPALPVEPSVLDIPPFSAGIACDDDYFSNAFARHAARTSNSGPPVSRSSLLVRKLSMDADTPPLPAATPSRLSLQGLTSLWGWKTASPVATKLPPPVSTKQVPQPAQPAQTRQEQTLPSRQGFESVSLVSSAKAGVYGTARRLLRLEASPPSKLDFTQVCPCDTGAHIFNV